jgi:hypothetical protein
MRLELLQKKQNLGTKLFVNRMFDSQIDLVVRDLSTMLETVDLILKLIY